MTYVAGVSWPRSGHHLLVRILQEYFGDKFQYCEFYTPEDCCRTFPCARPGTIKFSKNHDFDLNLEQYEDVNYIIQYREFIPAVVSNFELFVCNGEIDSEFSFRKFASMEWTKYQNFLEKWVTSPFGKRQFVLAYEEFTANPVSRMQEVIKLFVPDRPVDETRLHEITGQIVRITTTNDGKRLPLNKGISNYRNPIDFRYYSQELFEVLERLKLGRNEVEIVFQRLLNRKPAENNMLNLQCIPSIEALEKMLLNSDEYFKAAGVRR